MYIGGQEVAPNGKVGRGHALRGYHCIFRCRWERCKKLSRIGGNVPHQGCNAVEGKGSSIAAVKEEKLLLHSLDLEEVATLRAEEGGAGCDIPLHEPF